MYSLKHFNFTKPILRSNVDFETAAISPLDKTISCPRSSIYFAILLGFSCSKHSISPWKLLFRFTVSKICVFLPKTRNWRLEYSSCKRAAPFLIHCCSCKGCSAFLHPLDYHFDPVDVVASCSLCT